MTSFAGIEPRRHQPAGAPEPQPSSLPGTAAARFTASEIYPLLTKRIMEELPSAAEEPVSSRHLFERVQLGAMSTMRLALSMLCAEGKVESSQIPATDLRGGWRTVRGYRRSLKNDAVDS